VSHVFRSITQQYTPLWTYYSAGSIFHNNEIPSTPIRYQQTLNKYTSKCFCKKINETYKESYGDQMQAICFANIVSTITYDEANAPFLAIRCLHQFAIENQDRHPGASRVILNDFYVDLLSGGNDVSKLRRLKGEVTDILQYAGFHLHKWNTNEPIIFDGSSEVQELPRSNEIKTLRIY